MSDETTNEVIKKVSKNVLEVVRRENPYPEDIFTPLSDEEIKEYVECLKKNGFSPERIHSEWARGVWNNCCDKMEEIMKLVIE